MTLKHGSTRMVLLLGALAFKVPSFVEWRLFLLGLLGNMQEAKFAKTGWPELAPIFFYLPGGFLVVMKRAQPLSRAEWASFDPEAFCQRENYLVPAEFKMCSFGRIGAQIVAIDYGS